MKRAEIIIRLQRGEELVLFRLPSQAPRYRLGQDRVSGEQYDWLWNYHHIKLVRRDGENLYYRWAGNVPGHSPAKDE